MQASTHLSKYYLVLLAIFAMALGYLAIELWVNHRFSMMDFEVYYKAGKRLWGGENLYRMGQLETGGDGHFRYKYAPTAAIYFMPFMVLPFRLAAALYWVLLSGMAIALIHYMIQWAFPRQPQMPAYRLPLIPFLAFLVTVVHLELELHLGQVNLLLALCYVLVIGGYINGYRPMWVGLLWAATLFIKPYGLIFVPYFILYRQWQLLRWFVISLLFWLFLPLFFYSDWAVWQQQYWAWLEELRIQLAAKQTLLQPANHTLFSILVRYTPLRWAGLDDYPLAKVLFQLTVLAGIGFLLLKVIRKSPFGVSLGHLFHGALLIGLIPLLAQTDRNAFLFELPAVVLLLLYWRSLPFAGKLVACSGFLLCGGNIRDLWGKVWAPYWDALSLVAVGAVLILSALVLLLWRKPY